MSGYHGGTCFECGRLYAQDAAGVTRHIGRDEEEGFDLDDDHAAYGDEVEEEDEM